MENLKKHGVAEGEVSFNFENLFLRTEFNVEIAGIFDLL